MFDKLKETGFHILPIDTLVRINGSNGLIYTNLYYVILWSGTKGLNVIVEGEHRKLPANHLIFSSPNKKIEIKSKDTDAYAFLFSSEFYERTSFDSSIINSFIFYNQQYDGQSIKAPFNSSDFRLHFINEVIAAEEVNAKLHSYIAHNAIEKLILEAARLLKTEEDILKPEVQELDQIITNKFLTLLHQFYKKEKKVAFYADKLNITPRSLNKATVNSRQKHAKDLIIDKIIKESKRLLKYTNETIYNIAWELGFTDESNFSNFFKKYTGESPQEYKLKNKLHHLS